VFSDDDTGEADEGDRGQVPRPHTSLLRQQIEAAGAQSLQGGAIEDDHEERAKGDTITPAESRYSDGQRPSDFITDRLLHTPRLASSFGTSYGTISSQPTSAARRRASILIQERQEAQHRQEIAAGQEPDKEREPLLVRKVQLQDGTHTSIIVGQSTVPQTVFNSVNVLIGVGLLSLPLGIKYAGWIIGMIFLFLAAVVTQYTAKLLAYVLDVDGSFVNYSDVAFISFGNGTRKVVQALFSLELTAANVALVVLFADSLNALIPGLQIWEWKVICGIILIPLNFVPLRLLAVTSVLGILCCTGLVLIVFIDGFIKPHSPGSRREPGE
jgi:vesicular inhibitory amino acid transporter